MISWRFAAGVFGEGAFAVDTLCLNQLRLLLSRRAIFLGGSSFVRSIIIRSTPKIFATRIFAASFSLFCSLPLSLFSSLRTSLDGANRLELYDERLMRNVHSI